MATASDRKPSKRVRIRAGDLAPPVPVATAPTPVPNLRPLLPVAKWMGIIELAQSQIDCYVLEDGRRVLSINGAVRALAGLETGHGRLDKYIGITALKPYIDVPAIMDGLIEFEIPGNNFGNARGLTTDQFEEIMGAFVAAMTEEVKFTRNQLQMAFRCALLLRGLAKTGLVALVDEATGYQHNRAENELQVRLKAYISSDLRVWSKTFNDEFWEQLGRLTGWKDSLTNRPRYWGKLVIKFIYDTLPKEVADYLKSNRPPKGVMWHQQLTENYGVRMLVTRCIEVTTLARTCQDMQELSEKVALHFGRGPMQFSLSDLMNEDRPIALTKRRARSLRQEARQQEIMRVVPSCASGLIEVRPDTTVDDDLLQPSLLDLVTMDLPEAPGGDVSLPIPDEIVEMIRAAELEARATEAFETAHEKFASGRATRLS